ncbi:MAG: GNAT family N-acetyltransferase [Chloroflexi bacterium]|nr:MAG: GNAT family N-acetyltransferase [Chloroflexota bacterium]
MTLEYRPLVHDDLEQAVIVESTAFYNKPTPDRLDQLREFFPPDWTVGAFVDGRLVADVRTIPMARRINGSATPFGAIGPVACLSAYRRQGHVGRLLRLALERMREQGIALSGLFTPHDALYARFGWERSEARKQYYLRPSDIRMRVKGAPGTIETVEQDDWARLDAIYRKWAAPRNGPLHRVEPWWRQNVLRHYDETTAGLGDNDAFVWKNANGDDEGYVSYYSRAMPRTDRYAPWEVLVRDFVSLSGDAYLGLWQHLLAHDIATRLAVHMPVDDPFADLVEDPRKIELPRAEGPMIRVVDVERALSRRPFVGSRPVSFTMRVTDPSAPWNEVFWRIDAGEGQVQVERKDGDADVELAAGTLAPLYTGFLRPDVAAGVGLLKVNRPEALEDMREAFAVTRPPYSNDWY